MPGPPASVYAPFWPTGAATLDGGAPPSERGALTPIARLRLTSAHQRALAGAILAQPLTLEPLDTGDMIRARDTAWRKPYLHALVDPRFLLARSWRSVEPLAICAVAQVHLVLQGD